MFDWENTPQGACLHFSTIYVGQPQATGIHVGLRILISLTPGSAPVTPVLIHRMGSFGHHHRDDAVNTWGAVQYKLPRDTNTGNNGPVPVKGTPAPLPSLSPGYQATQSELQILPSWSLWCRLLLVSLMCSTPGGKCAHDGQE